jgi:hypothetical protein
MSYMSKNLTSPSISERTELLACVISTSDGGCVDEMFSASGVSFSFT